MTNSNVIYPNERDNIQLRKGFTLTSDGYLSRGSLLYIIETVQDLYNECDPSDALAAKAAHILFNIATAHPFIDGNKRTAFGTADIFLRLNGHFIKVDAQEGQSIIVQIATGEIVEDSVRKWTRQRLNKL
ncbi:MAG: type II toxin-antitoxin system death-on-curing family toxin [Nitrososphaera sp.]